MSDVLQVASSSWKQAAPVEAVGSQRLTPAMFPPNRTAGQLVHWGIPWVLEGDVATGAVGYGVCKPR